MKRRLTFPKRSSNAEVACSFVLTHGEVHFMRSARHCHCESCCVTLPGYSANFKFCNTKHQSFLTRVPGIELSEHRNKRMPKWGTAI